MAQGNTAGPAMGVCSDLENEARENARVREGLDKRVRWYKRRQSATDTTQEAGVRDSARLTKLSGLALVLVTLAYLGLELSWNLSMLETISRPGASRAELESMAVHGRWLAAFGLVWALIRSLLFSRKSGVDGLVNYILFGSSIVVAFAGIGSLYDKAIDSLLPSASMRAFELAAHRGWAMNDDLEPERQARVVSAVRAPTSIALWGLYVNDPVIAGDARAEYEARRSGLSEDAIKEALARYPEIEATRRKLAAGSDRLAEFEGQYKKYLEMSHKALNPSFGVASWRREGIQTFSNATCGMLPNDQATREQFAKELTKSCINTWKGAGQAYLEGRLAAQADPVVLDNNGVRVRLSEVINLDEAQFTRFVRDRSAGLADEQLPTESTVKSNGRAHEVIAATIVPPLSMTLSAIGIVANLGGVLALLFGLKKVQGIASVVALAVAVVFIPASAPAGMANAWDAFKTSNPVLAFIASKVITAEQTILAAKRGLTW